MTLAKRGNYWWNAAALVAVLLGAWFAAYWFHIGRKAEKTRPADPQTQVERGRILLEQGEAGQARAEFEEAIRQGASEVSTYIAHARACIVLNETDAALRSLDAALAKEPRNQEARQLRGDCYNKKGDLARAMADYGELRTTTGEWWAARSAPRAPNPEVESAAADLLRQAEAAAIRDETDEAIARYNAVLSMDISLGTAAVACQNRGNIYRRKGDLERALRDYQQAIRFNPANAGGYVNRGLVYAQRGDHVAAIQDYNEALRFIPKLFEALYNRATSRRELGELDTALQDITEALRVNPEFALGYIVRGGIFARQQEWAKAGADYETAKRLAPTLPEAWAALAQHALHGRRYSEAAAHFDKTLSLELSTAGRAQTLNSIAWLRATCPARSVRNGRKAVAEAMEACELSNWAEFSYIDTLAAAYAEQGEFEKATDFQWFALGLIDENDNGEGAEERLRLYEQRRPYRESESRPSPTPLPRAGGSSNSMLAPDINPEDAEKNERNAEEMKAAPSPLCVLSLLCVEGSYSLSAWRSSWKSIGLVR